MYSFRDVTESSTVTDIPSEALKINGSYIEDKIPGYRTLYASGRELLAPALTTTEVTRRDGVIYASRRFPERVITVGFQLIAESNTAFREAFNSLSQILNVENATLIFADEPDKFFVGTPSGIGSIDPGRNAVTGEIEITCCDPYKYSVNEYTAVPDSGGVITVNYGGTVPGFPVLSANFDNLAVNSTADGCGYVAFVNDRGKIIQLGDPDELDGETYEKSQTLINKSFQTSDSFGSSVQSQWPQNVGIVSSDVVTQTGTAGLALAASEALGEYYLCATNYGTGDKWHGPSVTRSIPADSTGDVGASDFTLTYRCKVCTGKKAEDAEQRGSLQMLLLDANNNIVAGVNILKSKVIAAVRFYVNGSRVEEADIDLSYYNRYFGTNNTDEGTKTVKSVTVTKTGSLIEFNAGGIQRSYVDSAISNTAVTKVQWTFMQYGTKAALSRCGLYSAKFVKHNCTTWKDVPNKFSAGDQLEADCSSAEVLLNDLFAPYLGAIGNDWETFYLLPGDNKIATFYSDWVPESNRPEFQIRYREAFL